ncbi:hypothetical protein EVG59_04335 [Salmonella enterica subsp. enterica serovar Dortmund]|nr:hypothetical protein [Salmonella enterica subsp. enterica serovar Dortmund]ECB1958499.1 hypothetical protein [Salmonella enterica subsp. enterica serovar Dortmund]HAV1239621.1 hypothetical protein [Salmonella enterica]
MDISVQVELSVEATDNRLYASVNVKNTGDIPVYIDTRYIPKGVRFISDQLHVICNGAEVKFSGYRYNTGGEYYVINPGQKEKSDRIDLVQDYLIPSGTQNCSFYINPWVAINPKIKNENHDGVDIYQFKSNIVHLTLDNPVFGNVFRANHKEIQ